MSIQKLIAWLEDTHIRRLPVADRTPLYHSPFIPAVRQYLNQLDAPTRVIPALTTDVAPKENVLLPSLAWLVDLALNLRYSDDAAFFNEPVDPWDGLCVPVISDAAHSPDVQRATTDLLRTLGIDTVPESPDDGLCVAADAVEYLTSDIPDITNVAVPTVDTISLGFSTGDEVVDRAATIMRILHVRQLRDLQSEINDLIADMQAVTADPKTNSKLGKVGR